MAGSPERGRPGFAGYAVKAAARAASSWWRAAIFGAAAGCKVFLAPDRPTFRGDRATGRQPAGPGGRVRRGLRDHVADRDQQSSVRPCSGSSPCPTPNRPTADHTCRGGHHTTGCLGDPHRHSGRCRVVRGDDVTQRTPLRLRARHPRLLPGSGVDVELPAPRAGDCRPGSTAPAPALTSRSAYRQALSADSPVFARGERIHHAPI